MNTDFLRIGTLMRRTIFLLIVLVLSVGSVATAQSELNRVGVDANRQHPLSLREALSMALENNHDIEVARENVRIAEFDLRGAQGLYDPKLFSQAFYERTESPIASVL